MKRKLLGAGMLFVLWAALVRALDRRSSKQRRELWAEATRDNASR